MTEVNESTEIVEENAAVEEVTESNQPVFADFNPALAVELDSVGLLEYLEDVAGFVRDVLAKLNAKLYTTKSAMTKDVTKARAFLQAIQSGSSAKPAVTEEDGTVTASVPGRAGIVKRLKQELYDLRIEAADSCAGVALGDQMTSMDTKIEEMIAKRAGLAKKKEEMDAAAAIEAESTE